MICIMNLKETYSLGIVIMRRSDILIISFHKESSLYAIIDFFTK